MIKLPGCLVLLSFLFSYLIQPIFADTPLPQSKRDIINIGLQMVRTRADWSARTTAAVPITVSNILEGRQKLSTLSPADQDYIHHAFVSYANSKQSFSDDDDDMALRAAAKISLDNPVQETYVSFKLRPYITILPLLPPTQTLKDGAVGYGQLLNLDDADFAVFLTSLTPLQKKRITYSFGIKVKDFDPKQSAYITHLWQVSSRPDYAKLSLLPATGIVVCFYLEADVTQSHQSGSITYRIQLPLPSPSTVSWGFNSITPGEVWNIG